MQLLEGENWPLIPQLHLGDAVISATLDTGSSSSITLYQGALDMPGVRSALVQKGEVTSGGFPGEEKFNEYVFNKPVGFARFGLPSGAAVTLRNKKGSSSNLANVGNKFFASMGLKMMLDYRHGMMTFFGDCDQPEGLSLSSNIPTTKGRAQNIGRATELLPRLGGKRDRTSAPAGRTPRA